MPGFALTLGFCSCLRFKKDESSRWGGDLVSGPVELRRALRSASFRRMVPLEEAGQSVPGISMISYYMSLNKISIKNKKFCIL